MNIDPRLFLNIYLCLRTFHTRHYFVYRFFLLLYSHYFSLSSYSLNQSYFYQVNIHIHTSKILVVSHRCVSYKKALRITVAAFANESTHLDQHKFIQKFIVKFALIIKFEVSIFLFSRILLDKKIENSKRGKKSWPITSTVLE